MYDICLISKLVELAELIEITEEDLESIGAIMSEKIGLEVMKFFNRYDELGIANDTNEIAKILHEKRALIYDVLYVKAVKYTFHLQVKEKGLIDFVKRLNLNTLLLTTDNKEKTVEDLEWLLSKEEFCISGLEARRKSDFDIFRGRMIDLNSKSQSTGVSMGVKSCKDASQVISKNLSYFYNRNEKKQYTGMHSVINGVSKIEEAINGLKYNILCDKADIADYTRRRFF